MKKNFNIFLIFFFFNHYLTAQFNIDSLKMAGKTEILNGNYETAEQLLNKALELSIENESLKEKAIIHNNLGVLYWKMGKYSNGINSAEKALETYQLIGNDTLIGQSQYNLGLQYKSLGSYELAIEHFIAALELFAKTKQNKLIAFTYDVLGNIQNDLENYSKAISFHKNSLEIYTSIGYQKGIARAFNNIGQVYINIGEVELAKKNLFKAHDIKVLNGLSTASNNSILGNFYLQQNQIDSAEFYYKESLKEIINEGNHSKLATSYWHLGELHTLKKEFKEAEYYLSKAFVLADSMQLNLLLIDVLSAQVKINPQNKSSTEIIQKYDRIINLKAIVLGENSRKQLAKLEVEYDVLKKVNALTYKDKQLELGRVENENLNYQNFALYSAIIVIGIIILIVVLFLFKLRKQKIKTEDKNNELLVKNKLIDTLHKELSHRTKNYYQMFGGMLRHDKKLTTNKESKLLLSSYINRVDAMSQIQEHLLENNTNLTKKVQLNLYLSDLLLSINLVLNTTEPKVEILKNFTDIYSDYDKALRLGLIMNELVSNAFEHGFKNVNAPKISVTLELDKNAIIMRIEDNGVGFVPTQSNKNISKGIDLMQLIIQNVQGKLTYEKRIHGTGINIFIPN